LPNPEHMGVGKHSAQLSFTKTELYIFEFSVSRNANFKNKVNRGSSYQTLIPNKLDFSFRAPNHCAQFNQNQIIIADVRVFTDRLTE